MDKAQRVLFERLVAFGVDKPEANFLVKFRERSAKAVIKGFRRPRRRRCLAEGCTNLVEPPREFCKVHAFTSETRRFCVKELNLDDKGDF